MSTDGKTGPIARAVTKSITHDIGQEIHGVAYTYACGSAWMDDAYHLGAVNFFACIRHELAEAADWRAMAIGRLQMNLWRNGADL